jgi:ABC-type lipoprotein release transport system permease subunit
MSNLTPEERRLSSAGAIGLLAGIIAGGIVALWLGVYGLLVAIAVGMARVGHEVWRLRRSSGSALP